MSRRVFHAAAALLLSACTAPAEPRAEEATAGETKGWRGVLAVQGARTIASGVAPAARAFHTDSGVMR